MWATLRSQGCETHVSRLGPRQQPGPFEQRRVRIGIRIDVAENRKGGTREAAIGKERPQFGRQHEVAQSHGAHHVVEDTRIASLEAIG